MPKLPTGGNKRKMPSAPTPEMLKRMRMDAEEPHETESLPRNASQSRKAYMRTEEEEEDASMDQSDFAPGGDADYFVEEDEEGRFYGGGLTSQQKDILNIFDQVTSEGTQDDVRRVLCVQAGLTPVLILDVRTLA
jgi:beta-catenin-like protein 1